jgi:hypothetical protein
LAEANSAFSASLRLVWPSLATVRMMYGAAALDLALLKPNRKMLIG